MKSLEEAKKSTGEKIKRLVIIITWDVIYTTLLYLLSNYIAKKYFGVSHIIDYWDIFYIVIVYRMSISYFIQIKELLNKTKT